MARRFGLPALMVGLFLAGAGVLWGLGWMRGRAACDQYDYHLKAILKFATELPRPDVQNYQSATTPGYHLLMAVVARLVSAEPVVLQIVASVFTILLLWAVGRGVARAGVGRGWTWLETAALALPIVASPYVFSSGVWLLPDNAGWVLVLLILALAGAVPRVPACFDGRRLGLGLALGAVLLVLLVLVRQSHLWVAAPFVLGAWLSTTGEHEGCLTSATRAPERRIGPTMLAIGACLPAIAVLGWFAWLWHGLTPPGFQGQHQSGVNFTTPAFFFALVGVFSPFFLAWWWPGFVRVWREQRATLFGAGAIGFVAAMLPVTTFLREPRSGGLWQVVERVGHYVIPDAANPGGRTSLIIVGLATIGGPILAAWLTLVEGKRRWIIAAALTAFVAAQSANANCWQRYHEPLILILFALIAAGSSRPSAATETRLIRAARIAGPLLLTILLAGLIVYGLYGRDPTIPNP